MKRIPRIIIFDYLLFCLGLFLMIVLLEPFGTRNFIQAQSHPYFYYVLESLFYFCIFIFCEVMTSYLLKFPCDYTQPKEYQIRRLVCLALPNIVLNALLDGEYFICLRFGIENWHYNWITPEGVFTLQWFLHDLLESLYVGSFVILYYFFVTCNRMQRHQLKELQQLNAMLEAEQSALSEPDPIEPETIILLGESRESLEVNPQEILYIESVANYVNIVYFNNSDLCQKRLRSSLHDIENTLESYPYMVHIHRAFVVNLHFVTNITGNAAGYKLELFGTDKTLPVSKANIPAFKEMVQKLQ